MTVEIAQLHLVCPADRTPAGPDGERAVTPEALDAFLAECRDHERPAPADLLDGRRGRPRLLLTCDRVDRRFVEHALPVLERHGAHCVLFVVPDWAKGVREPLERSLWRALAHRSRVEIPAEGFVSLDGEAARRRALAALWRLYAPLPTAEREGLVAALGVDPHRPEPGGFLDPDQLRELAAHPLLTVGAMSRTHAFLPRLRAERLAAEVAGARRDLESWTGTRVEWFAYPFGALDGAVRRCVSAAGFRFACVEAPGPSVRPDPLALPRAPLAAAVAALA